MRRNNTMKVIEICNKNGDSYCFVFSVREPEWLRVSGITTETWAKMALNLFGWEAVCKDWM